MRVVIHSLLIFIFFNHSLCHLEGEKRSFTIDISTNSFLKDGKPFRFISGAIHYFRVHPTSWRDRIRKLKYAGCNTLETYVEWASHEPEPGIYDFTGGLDLIKFISIANEENLQVILRPGPFIDAERDMGGLPYWLLRENPGMQLRTNDPNYIHFVDQFYNVLFPMLRPHLYENGGPIIMLQLENEYGSYPACDFYYTTHLKELATSLLGNNVTLFTTDGYLTKEVSCGKIAGVYATVDFGPGTDVSKAFGVQRLFEPKGPLVNSEFYPGWLDYWGEPHSTRTTESVIQTLDEVLSMGASVNIFVFHGGTNFGMTTAANIEDRFKVCPTSYDYDAPLTEAGDPTEKYFAIRNLLKKYVTVPSGPVPEASPKGAYGDINLSFKTSVFDMMDVLESTTNEEPLTFEALSIPNGIVIYSSIIPNKIPDPAILTLNDLHDRGYVFIGRQMIGLVSRDQGNYQVPIYGAAEATLTVIVESQGRVAYGGPINDFKGITGSVTLGSAQVSTWTMTPLPLFNSTKLQEAFHDLSIERENSNLPRKYENLKGGMSFYEGVFEIPDDPLQPKDTFLRLDGWTKGYAWMNDFLLGRYWPVEGPQVTLYVPAGALKKGTNSFLLLELEKGPCEDFPCKVALVDTPEINGPTPTW